MKFKHFLIEQRSKKISEEEAEKIINTKCKASLKGTPIYRGRNISLTFYAIIDPKKYVRTSANTLNYYTLLIDYILPQWKNYPKRSQSIICSTSPERAKVYGTLYRVYPFDGSKIGVCPESDIWASFLKSLGGWLETLNIELKELAEANDIDLSETDPKLLKKQIKSLKRNVAYYEPNMKIFKKWTENKKLDLLKLIEEALDPNKNGFKLVKAGDKIPYDREVWIDGKCILKRI